MMAVSRGHGVNRVLEKLKSCIDNGNFYEAHQMYRTLYFRYIAQKKYAELLDLLYDGAVLLLKKEQKESGSDLAILLIDVLNKSGTIATDETIEKVARLYRLMSPDSPERSSYIQASLKWSRRAAPESSTGHPKLHELIALTLWKEKNYSQSRYHFLHSTDGDGCASMLVDYHIAKGYASEVDLFIAQAVLQFLCLRNKATATVVFYRYTEQHPDIVKGPPFLLPLLNFLWFLLLAVESGKLTVFTVLCEQYQPSIGRDPTYTEYLDRIGQLFFGLPPPKPKSGGVLGNLLQSLMGGLHDADDSDTDASLSLPGSSNTSIASATTTALETEELD